jgi:hypothetical protein
VDDEDFLIDSQQIDLTELYSKLDSIQEQLDETNEKLGTLHEDNEFYFKSFYGDDYEEKSFDSSVFDDVESVSASLENLKEEFNSFSVGFSTFGGVLLIAVGLLIGLLAIRYFWK